MAESRTKRALPVVAAALLLGGCLGGLKEPDVRMEGVRLGGLGLQGGLVYVQLMVVNPNRGDLAASRLTYDLDVQDPDGEGWVDFAEGEHREEVRVAGRDSVRVDVPVEFRYRDAGRALRTAISRGALNYRVRGTVDVSRPLRVEVPFRKNGIVTMDGSD